MFSLEVQSVIVGKVRWLVADTVVVWWGIKWLAGHIVSRIRKQRKEYGTQLPSSSAPFIKLDILSHWVVPLTFIAHRVVPPWLGLPGTHFVD